MLLQNCYSNRTLSAQSAQFYAYSFYRGRRKKKKEKRKSKRGVNADKKHAYSERQFYRWRYSSCAPNTCVVLKPPVRNIKWRITMNKANFTGTFENDAQTLWFVRRSRYMYVCGTSYSDGWSSIKNNHSVDEAFFSCFCWHISSSVIHFSKEK